MVTSTIIQTYKYNCSISGIPPDFSCLDISLFHPNFPVIFKVFLRIINKPLITPYISTISEEGSGEATNK
jgi:hypothetical protein